MRTSGEVSDSSGCSRIDEASVVAPTLEGLLNTRPHFIGLHKH
jgi:hypothetical protein